MLSHGAVAYKFRGSNVDSRLVRNDMRNMRYATHELYNTSEESHRSRSAPCRIPCGSTYDTLQDLPIFTDSSLHCLLA